MNSNDNIQVPNFLGHVSSSQPGRREQWRCRGGPARGQVRPGAIICRMGWSRCSRPVQVPTRSCPPGILLTSRSLLSSPTTCAYSQLRFYLSNPAHLAGPEEPLKRREAWASAQGRAAPTCQCPGRRPSWCEAAFRVTQPAPQG